MKGYQYEPEQYVVVEPADLEKLKLASTKIIEIEGFVDVKEVHPTLYEAPYFAGPDGPVAAKAYALLGEALRESGKVGIGKVVLRDREDVVMIAPLDGALVLYRLRYPSEVRSVRDVPQLEGSRNVDGEQLKLARHLVETMATSFDRIDVRDRYHEALREIVDIMTALKASIEKAKSQREPMIKAVGKAKAEAEETGTDVKAAAGPRSGKTTRRKQA